MSSDWAPVHALPTLETHHHWARWIKLDSVVDVSAHQVTSDLWRITGFTTAGESFKVALVSPDRCREFMQTLGIPFAPPVESAGE